MCALFLDEFLYRKRLREVAAVMTAVFPSSFPMMLFPFLLGLTAHAADMLISEAAAGMDEFTGDPVGLARSEEGRNRGDIIDLTDAGGRRWRLTPPRSRYQ